MSDLMTDSSEIACKFPPGILADCRIKPRITCYFTIFTLKKDSNRHSVYEKVDSIYF